MTDDRNQDPLNGEDEESRQRRLQEQLAREAHVAPLLFGNRPLILLLFAAVTAFLTFQASQLRPDASFEKMVPVSHPYIENYLDNKQDLAALGNFVRIVVQTTEGDIFDADFQETLKEITDEVFFITGVDRSKLESLWTPNVRWSEVTEEGFRGGAVIPDDYDGSARALQQLRENVDRSGQIGRLVANNFRSAAIKISDFLEGKRRGLAAGPAQHLAVAVLGRHGRIQHIV